MNPKSILRQCSSWADFRRLLEDLTPGEKGDCFEELTLYLLKLHPTYKTKIEEVWLGDSYPD
jgi:predicted helicase